ncbi:L-aspartate oxidase [Desulfopila sp. IMCC35006]|uniref:L-aspartate oxidase n=1 Tax=Desulfopila sp. IMCC35006 TaxID=2569542 RepID=UPI0010ABDC5B|nr:L-aspartate oxidase [Desulfopila sp. IMCC35006]TKB26295.1 L-aspartate oxidase [Desulfopila sp. IMCC35006]
MESDFLIIGSGIAGLSLALKASRLGTVNVITKKEEVDTATNLAQGGIAAVLNSEDSFADHIHDTLKAGDGLCDEKVVRMVVENGPERVKELIALGVKFVKEKDGNLSLGREGGHSKRRVAHAYDLTGREIERALIESVEQNKKISLYENHMCVDLITEQQETTQREISQKRCVGAYVIDELGTVKVFLAKIVVLCTGGAGKVYLYTSNPDIATGDGVAVAHRVGAAVSNMEFVQFHPTCLYHHQAKNFLISEAVRGEGAILVDENNNRFMARYEPVDMELATRDKVARAIDTEMKRTGADCVYLDISHKEKAFLKERFPTIYEKCLSLGIDIAKMPIPVVPAAHYLCGGVKTDIHGRTTIDGLFALGETSCTGLHGGNRLASNSLLEAVVYAENVFRYCESNWPSIMQLENNNCYHYDNADKEKIDEEILINHNWDVIRRVMWNYVGIVRKESRLMIAQQRIVEVRKEIEEIVEKFQITPNMLELRNISLVASLIIEASLARKQSKGLHYILDYPAVDVGESD